MLAAALGVLLPGCCVNPFVATDTHVAPDAPGSPRRETRGTLEEHTPALQRGHGEQDGPGTGFDIRLVRVQPGVHLGTEQICDVAAAGRLEPIEVDGDGEPASPYSESATQRMSVQCVAPTGAR